MALTDVKSEQIQSSVALAGSPTTTTQSASDNSTKIATTAYVETAVANLVASAPAALNTLDELAAALNDDASFSTTVTNSIATKLPLAGGTMTGNLVISAASSPTITLTDTTNTVSLKMYSQDSDAIIGTYTNHPFKLFSNSGLALTLDTSQNATFAGTLDVDGASLTVGSSQQVNIVTSGSSLFPSLKVNNNGYIGSASATSAMQLLTSGEVIFASNVGIGTSNPGAKLNVEWTGSNSSTDNIARITAPVYPSLEFYSTNTTSTNRNWKIAGVHNAYGRFEILRSSAANGVANVSTFAIDHNGNFGFGAAPSSDYKVLIDGGIYLNAKSVIGNSGYFICGTNGFRWNNGTDQYNNVIMYDNGNMYVRGNVGIGTTNALKKLHIVGGGYDQIMINSDSGNNTNRLSGICGIDYTGNQFSIIQNFAQSGSQITYYGSADGSFRGVQGHKFMVNASATATTSHKEAMTIHSDGDVGIGTNVQPSGIGLAVSSNINSSQITAIEIQQNTTGAKKAAAAFGVAIQNGGASTNAADLTFHTASAGSLSERMRITSGGIVAGRHLSGQGYISFNSHAAGGGNYVNIKTNIYRASKMYTLLIIGHVSYSGERIHSIITGYAYAPLQGNTSSTYHGITNHGTVGVNVYYSSDDYLCIKTTTAGSYNSINIIGSSGAVNYYQTNPIEILAYTSISGTGNHYA